MRDKALARVQADLLDPPLRFQNNPPWPETLVCQSMKLSPAQDDVQVRSRVARNLELGHAAGPCSGPQRAALRRKATLKRRRQARLSARWQHTCDAPRTGFFQHRIRRKPGKC